MLDLLDGHSFLPPRQECLSEGRTPVYGDVRKERSRDGYRGRVRASGGRDANFVIQLGDPAGGKRRNRSTEFWPQHLEPELVPRATTKELLERLAVVQERLKEIVSFDKRIARTVCQQTRAVARLATGIAAAKARMEAASKRVA